MIENSSPTHININNNVEHPTPSFFMPTEAHVLKKLNHSLCETYFMDGVVLVLSSSIDLTLYSLSAKIITIFILKVQI